MAKVQPFAVKVTLNGKYSMQSTAPDTVVQAKRQLREMKAAAESVNEFAGFELLVVEQA